MTTAKLARGLFNFITRKPEKKVVKRVTLSREQKILGICDRVLQAKSATAKGPRFALLPATTYQLPHVLGCLIKVSDQALVESAAKYEGSVRNELRTAGINDEVSILLDPLRIEILNPKPPIIRLSSVEREGGASYWERICKAPVNDLKFNGVLLYDRNRSYFLSFSIAGDKFPHATFTGSTGAGKTVLLYNALISIAMRNSPEILSIVLCDKKGKTLPRLEGLPHLAGRIAIRIEDIETAVRVVDQELQRRMTGGDLTVDRQHVLLVIDEFNDTISAVPELVDRITSIARTGREWGIHLWLAGQKLSGSKAFPPVLYGNLTLRFVGRAATQAEARINTGDDDSQAHNLPPGRGLFYLVTGSGPIEGVQMPAMVRGLFLGENEVPGYLAQIRKRWGDKRPHFTMGGWNQPERPRPPLTHPDPLACELVGPEFVEHLKTRQYERELTPYYVMRICREWYGENVLNWMQARTLVQYAEEQ
jgi:hypothetical protein